jgi:DNA polymerase-3 subunit alpha
LLRWPAPPAGQSDPRLEQLATILTPWRGGQCQLAIQYVGERAKAALSLDPGWNVKPTPELLEQLETLVGRKGLTVLYSLPPGSQSASSAAGSN